MVIDLHRLDARGKGGTVRLRTRHQCLWIAVVLFMTGSIFGQSTIPTGMRPGKLIHDEHDPRNGFIVVDARTRLAYIQAATLWRPFDVAGADVAQGQSRGVNKAGLPKTLPNDTVVVCDFTSKELGGTTPKFDCDHLTVYGTIEDAARRQNAIPHALKKAKVRYGAASGDVKPYSTVITTRIAWALGFFADIETPVREVICNGCTSDPFHQKGP